MNKLALEHFNLHHRLIKAISTNMLNHGYTMDNGSEAIPELFGLTHESALHIVKYNAHTLNCGHEWFTVNLDLAKILCEQGEEVYELYDNDETGEYLGSEALIEDVTIMESILAEGGTLAIQL